jgi:hypothetical protein
VEDFAGVRSVDEKSKRPMTTQNVCTMTCWCRSLPIKGSQMGCRADMRDG